MYDEIDGKKNEIWHEKGKIPLEKTTKTYEYTNRRKNMCELSEKL